MLELVLTKADLAGLYVVDDATLLPDWFYIGVYRPVRVSEPQGVLGRVPSYVHAGRCLNSWRTEQEKRIEDTIDKLLEDWR